MTYLQIWKAFNHVCPLKGVRDWRPFGYDKIVVWLHGNRKIKVIKVFMIDEYTFKIEPSSDVEWLRFEKNKEKAEGIPTIMDDANKKGK